MAHPRDYRKPRNKELKDLLVYFPQAVRVVEASKKGRLLWQNRAAEQLDEEPEWEEQPTTWQGKKALLLTPGKVPVSESPRVQDLEDEVTRLKRTQRRTARKKRQAEEESRKQDKVAEKFRKKEQQLREKLETAEQRIEELSARLEGAEPGRDKELARELARKERSEDKLKRSLDELKESLRHHKEEKSGLAVSLQEEQERAEALQSRVEQLQNDKKALEEWVEQLEQEKSSEESRESPDLSEYQEEIDKLEELLAKRVARFKELEGEYKEYRRSIEEGGEQSSRELGELRAELEQERKAFQDEKTTLEEELARQQQELKALQAEVAARPSSALSEDELEELREELEEVKTDLTLATRREIRLSEKLESLQEVKDEQARVLEEVKGELDGSRQREKELKETISLYGEVRQELDESRTALKEARARSRELERVEETLREDLARAAARIKELESQAPVQVAATAGLKLKTEAGSPGLQKTLQQQLDFAQARLRETEQKLDAALAELKREKAQAQGAREAEKLAFQDLVTGLPNRHMVDRYLDFSYKQARARDHAIALFLIDLDGFRVLNDTFGRDWGDRLLRAVGERLNGMRGSTHLFARHSQDRFMLLAANVDKVGAPKFINDASKSIIDALNYPFEVEGESVSLTGTIGVCLGPLASDDVSQLYLNAERALTSAKARGAGHHHVFDDSLRQLAQRDAAYKRQMEHAIAKDEFSAVYQPVLDLREGVAGMELLIRWHHRDQRVLKPSEFLDVAVESGLIFSLTEKLWPRAFQALSRWRKVRKGLTLSLNLSDREMLSSTLLDRTTRWAKEAGLEPSAIVFEVRDSSRLRISSNWWTILEKIRSQGFGLCLDDYGSDASLFGTLAYVGFQQAKMTVLDKKSPVCTPTPGASKGIRYCAKLVQTRLDKKGLLKAGFDQAQGYAVCQPLDEAEVDEFLS